jgi:hypothetical protein
VIEAYKRNLHTSKHQTKVLTDQCGSADMKSIPEQMNEQALKNTKKRGSS